MRSLSVILLFATACGSDLTTLEVICGETTETIPTVLSNPSVHLPPRYAAELPERSTLPPNPPSATTSSTGKVVDPLCLSADGELVGPVRASVQRFAERLEIPVVFAEGTVQGCVPVTTEKDLEYRGNRVSGRASYYSSCRFETCNTSAFILIDEEHLYAKREWLEEVVDHEIGHILSDWGQVARVNMHLRADYHVMSPTLHRGTQWTQEDIDLWCSASPCGRTELDGDWIYPVLPLPGTVADAGTSYLSGTAIDAGGYDGGLPSDAN